jgi:outer membrane protein
VRQPTIPRPFGAQRRRLVPRLVLLLVLLPAGPGSGSLAAEVPISLDEAVRAAIERNLDLRVATYAPAISRTDVRRALSIYNPRLSLFADHRGEDAPLSPDSPFVVRRRVFDLDASAEALLPSGATAGAAVESLWSRDNLDTTLSRFARPAARLFFSQPILRGFGREVTERDITAARDALEGSRHLWRARALDIAAAARDRYYSLIKARESLRTRQASLAAAREIHAGNRARVEAGILAAVELLDSELGVAQRERELLDAERIVRDESDGLRVLIQAPPGEDFVPLEAFPEEPGPVREDEAVAAALASRPELLRARVVLRTEEFRARVSRNALLPSLSLNGSAGVLGLGDEFGEALGELGRGTSPFWSVGVGFSYPIGNDAAKAEHAAAGLRSRQAEAEVRSLEEAVGLEVREALRLLDTRLREIEVARKQVALAEVRLESYVRRGRLGLALTIDVLRAESDLTAAREALTAAKADYAGAVTRLWRGTGELLERQGIRIDDRSIESLAWRESE